MPHSFSLRVVRLGASRRQWVARVIYLTSWVAILVFCAVTWLFAARLFF